MSAMARRGAWIAVVMGGALLAAGAARADCIDDIRAHYTDPFERPPYRTIKHVYDENGTELRFFQDIVETPLRTISAVNGKDATLVIDRDYWTGPSPEGPWTKGATRMPGDREAGIRAMYLQELANITEPECLGETERDGKTLLHFRFVTRTDPDATGTWFGARNDILVDPGTKLMVHWTQTDFENSFQQGVSKEVHVRKMEYDTTIRISVQE